MQNWLWLILAVFSLAPHASAGIARWDALPALDVMHLQGPHAGAAVCPMCRYGYDAGLLVFLPASTSADEARRAAHTLRAISASIDDDRFRSFLILAGSAPSPALLDAVSGRDGRWHVAHLTGSALTQASREFGAAFATRARGYVFAQRRLLLAFDPLQPSVNLADHALDAMAFLRATHARAIVSNDPDTPRGELWSAPNRLSSSIVFSSDAPAHPVRACFVDDASATLSHALAAVSLHSAGSPARSMWARTDAAGCVSLSATPKSGTMKARVWVTPRDPASIEIDAGSLQAGVGPVLRVTPLTRTTVTRRERIVGLPCEGCEAVFRDLPAVIESSGRIAGAFEPGETLELSGTVRDEDGTPRSGIVLHAYQTDRNGRYSTDPDASGTPAMHARLRGWVRTDANGRYVFHGIRPGSYPGQPVPQHVHMHVIEPGRCTYYLGDVLFDDDPLLDAALRSREQFAHGGSGIVRASGNADAGWKATRDITLGLNVRGYGDCSRADAHGPRG